MEKNFEEKVKELKKTIESEYENKVVCFLDILGMKKRIAESMGQDLAMIYARQKIFVDHSDVVKKGLNISMFSDCMYITANKENIQNVFGFVAKLTYTMLDSYNCNLNAPVDKQNVYDCIKIRGGISYGKALEFVGLKDEDAKSKIVNIITGPAVVEAYRLESEKAVYPRILVGDAILLLLKQIKRTEEEFCIIRDDKDGCHYFDFLKYLKDNEGQSMSDVNKYVEFVEKEINDLKNDYNNLDKKLSWFKEYLEKYTK